MTDSDSKSRANPALKIIIIAVLALGIGGFFYFDLNAYFNLATLKDSRDDLLRFTDANYAVAAMLFVAAYFAQTAFSLPGGAIMTLAGGFLFGSVVGTILVNLGATLGATCAFLAARYVLRDWVERKFGDSLAPLQAGFAQNAFSYLLTLRLIPLFPFFFGEPRVRFDAHQTRFVYRCNFHRHHPRQFRFRICRQTTRRD